MNDNDQTCAMSPAPFHNPFATSRLGQVAQLMGDEGRAIGHEGMTKVADICLCRGHDPDDDVALLIRHVLFSYANARNINVLSLPDTHAH